jgi:hypothetical protein
MTNQWDNEPDYLNFICEGFECEIIRHQKNPKGHLCGYILLPSDHVWYSEDYNDIFSLVRVHGGLTYSEYGEGNSDMWVLGFDCGHSCDYRPDNPSSTVDPTYYRTVEYVKTELEKLARQCRAVIDPPVGAVRDARDTVCKTCGVINSYISYQADYECKLCSDWKKHLS